MSKYENIQKKLKQLREDEHRLLKELILAHNQGWRHSERNNPYAFTQRVQAMELYAELLSRMVYRRDSNGKPIIRNGSFSVYDECDRAMAKVQPFRKDSKLGVIGAYNTGIREWTIEAKQKKRQCSFPILRPRARSALIAAIWISFPDRQSIKPALNVGQERVMKKLCEGGILTSL